MNNRPYPLHPFQLAIELAWDRGATPRILVLADREGVVLPDHEDLRGGWHRHHGASHRAPTLAHAILAAARSLGWPGGGK